MARNETFDVNDDRFDDEDDRRSGSRRKEGWSTTTKVIIGILAVGGICTVLCCGGIIFQVRKFAKNMENAVTEDPIKIVEIQKSITEMDVPANLPPKNGMNMDLLGLMQMKMVIYGDDETGSMMLMEMKFAGLSEEDMEKQFKQQAGTHGGPNQDINIESSETRKFTINGKECRFSFAKGTRDKSFTGFDELENSMEAAGDGNEAPSTETPAESVEAPAPADGAVAENTAPAENTPAENTTPEAASGEVPTAGMPEDNSLQHVRQVTGMFPSNGGFAFLFLIIPEESWDEDAVVKMIESIHKSP